jgi:L,D-peptidoglycan transpeptidase YkuD (ErfK/YbiS/YcfS/YnhG family)
MDLVVTHRAGLWRARFGEREVACAIGRAGATTQKREGDGKSPVGRWPLRSALYRPDRVAPPRTRFPCLPLVPEDGWCDDPRDPNYNRPVPLPYPARCEALWRDDAIYDVIVILGHNDDPPVPGAGSAIFLHHARKSYAPTEGCVGLAPPDLTDFLAQTEAGDAVVIGPGPPAA